MNKYLKVWISFAIDCFGYDEQEAKDLYKDHGGKLTSFLSSEEIERMFEWSALPVPNSLN